MGYRQSLLKGLGWNGFFRMSAKAVVFLKIILAYRFLSPREVGLYGLALIALGLLEMLTETGVNVIIVKEKQPISYWIDTAWIVSIGRGVMIAAFLFVSSFFLPSFFRDSGLFPLLAFTSIVPLFRGFINPAVAKFQKDLAFDKDAILQLSRIVTDVLFSGILLAIFHTALSLIWGLCISAFLEVVISFVFVHPRPKLAFKRRIAMEIINPGKWVNLAGVIVYAEQNFDNVIVGRMLGSTILGFYQTAFNLCWSLIVEIGNTFSQVLLPIFGRIGEEKKRLIRAVGKTFVPAVLIMLVPVLLLNIHQTQELLLLFLGEKWRPMLPLLPYLSIAAVCSGLNTMFNPLFYIKNRYRSLVALYGLNLLLLLGLLVFLIAHHGLIGAGEAAIVARLLLQPLFIWQARKVVREEKR